MTISLSFSGGISHANPVVDEKQAEIAGAIAKALRSVIEDNFGSGSGSVYVGSQTVTFQATSIGSL